MPEPKVQIVRIRDVMIEYVPGVYTLSRQGVVARVKSFDGLFRNSDSHLNVTCSVCGGMGGTKEETSHPWVGLSAEQRSLLQAVSYDEVAQAFYPEMERARLANMAAKKNNKQPVRKPLTKQVQILERTAIAVPKSESIVQKILRAVGLR